MLRNAIRLVRSWCQGFLPISNSKVERYITSVQAEVNADARYATYNKLMCACLTAQAPRLPEVARNALLVASDYWNEGRGSASVLDEMRVKCWQHADEIAGRDHLNTKDGIAMRAVICTLYLTPTEEDFGEDALRWFMLLLGKFGGCSAAVNELLDTENRSRN
ncbi:MAG: hypothetical protein HY255_07635 [Betaproteobacteria bacterium]|nr:hypothetical protein [Betaproteobacteria bacterium]